MKQIKPKPFFINQPLVSQCLRLPVLVQATGRKISAVHARLTCRVHAELGNKTLAACGVRVFLPLPPNATKVDAKVRREAAL